MNHFSRFIAVLSLAAGAAVAQPPLGPPPGGGLDIERLTVLLDLDAYQKGEVERVLTEQRATREQARDELLGKLNRTLSEQQLTKLKLLMETPRGPRGGQGGQGGPAPRAL